MMPRVVVRETNIAAPPGSTRLGIEILAGWIVGAEKKRQEEERRAVAKVEVLKCEQKAR